jgi:hypothetical protein
MTKARFKGFLIGIWDAFKRSIGLAMVAFFPGAGIGSIPFFGGNFLNGGLIAFGSMFAVVMGVMGVELASTSTITEAGREAAFRQAVTQGTENIASKK